jgi:hypothetical protein
MGNEETARGFNLCYQLTCLIGALVPVMALLGCSESAATGVPVPIPSVYVNCTTANCRSAISPNPKIFVTFTTSGCDNPYYGATISSSTSSITCSSSLGCYGSMTQWVDSTGASVHTLPSGTYSLCGVVDRSPESYPTQLGSEDAVGTIETVPVAATTANQLMSNWIDHGP